SRIVFGRQDRVGVLTINRPGVKNAIDLETMDELRELFETLRQEQETAVLLVTGADGNFSSGGDLKALAALEGQEAGRKMSLRMQGILNEMEGLDIPVLAAIEGYALGGGAEIALACDFRIASAGARFGFRQVNLGIIMGWGGGQRLARLVGRSQALRLLLTGETIDADEALRIGLIDRVVPEGHALAAAQTMAHAIAEKPPLAVRFAKRAIHRGRDMSLEAAVDYEAQLFAILWASAEHREAVRDILERRPSP
ncbi:MAG: enoyl-CoA hydratase/isomerase family protein, partial [Candidatus Methylomirabilales bacterium]